jgi:hypothetical protein
MSSESNSNQQSVENREKFVVPMKCQCGQVGTAIWEESAELSPQGPKALLVEVSSGFYIRVQKKNIGKSEVACAICESIVRK